MRILVSEGTSRMGTILLRRLSGEHRLRVARHPDSEAPGPSGIAIVDADLHDPEGAGNAVSGVDAIVHTGPAGPPALPPADSCEGERALLDRATRGTSVLLQAAVEAGVRRLVYCSSLEVFHEVPDDVYVSDQHRPRPGTAMKRLAYHLAEQVTREFARDYALGVTVLRLGRLVREDQVAAGSEPDLSWLDPRDAAAAVELALGRDHAGARNWTGRWQVRHVCHQPPHPKFLLDGIRGMGFEPRHDFRRQWAAAAGA